MNVVWGIPSPQSMLVLATASSLFYSEQMSTRDALSGVKSCFRSFTRARAVSRLVKQGIPSSTLFRLILTLSRLGERPLAEVDTM